MIICILWGEAMKERRGLFETIFGKKPQILNGYTMYKLLNTYSSSFSPYSGRAWDVNTVRAAIHSFARRAATVQPKHIRRGDGKMVDVSSELNNLLQFQPNPQKTAYQFYYRLAAQYKLYNNAFVYPVWGPNGKLVALYNVNASQIDLLERDGILFCKFRFVNGKYYVFPYSDFIHVGSMFADHDIFGSDNAALSNVLQTANTFNQSMGKFAELVAIIRGILKVNNSMKGEDLNARRDDFIRDNLRMENNGAGIIVTDNKFEYTPITDKQTPIPTGQLEYIKGEIYDYFGTNENIVQNKATPEQEEDFYEGEIHPFLVQLQQAFTNCLFSQKERGYGNEITAEGNKLQFAKLPDKLSAIRYLSEIGALQLDQALTTLGFPPIGGEEGKRRVQTLNMVNAALADTYQIGTTPKNNPKKETEPAPEPEPEKEEDETNV